MYTFIAGSVCRRVPLELNQSAMYVSVHATVKFIVHIEEVIEYMKKTANSVIQGVAIVGTPLMGKTVFLGYVFFENEKKL